ncbi:protein TIFY 6B-like isoform X2 [Andrographis paniculata]|uniref:protein TIFY 6B-like isoform X2 n=1 Tax=Andrographis paniculata TaxID=175694 RepID=UPI0021E96763|nr:protein TIFY 6B-like isoform X2 [Andrographis paniculata]
MEVGLVGFPHDHEVIDAAAAAAQLTIFYDGSVCVYDNISRDKAEAIMLLAGNGTSASAATPVQAPLPRSSFVDGFVSTQSCTPIALCSSSKTLPSISIPRSIAFSNSGTSSSNSDEPMVSKLGDFLISSNKGDRAIVVDTQAPSGTVPQFRRKSLARFLAKRKDRVIGASPFVHTQSTDSSSSSSVPGAVNSILTINSCPNSTIDRWKY